jgi:hypothetical protein
MIKKETPRYTRVQICPNPKCGHHGGKKGTLDLHGKFSDAGTGDEEVAIVLVDGGGACGPYRFDELTPLAERDLEVVDGGNERHGAIFRDKATGERLRACYLCGRPEDEHPWESAPQGGVRRGKCPPMTVDGPSFGGEPLAEYKKT